MCATPLQVVPLPLAEGLAAQCSSSPQAPIEPTVLAAQAAAGAAPLQPFEVRQLPFRAYAVVLTPRYAVQLWWSRHKGAPQLHSVLDTLG